MANLTLFPIAYTKEDLAAVPERTRTMFLMLSMFANEIAVLQRHSLAAYAALESASPVRNGFASASTLVSTRLLIGRLVEGRKLTSTPHFNPPFNASLEGMREASPGDPFARKKMELAVKARADFNDLVGQQWWKSVRDKLSFHTDHEKVAEAFHDLPAGASNLYGAAESIIERALARAVGMTDSSEAFAFIDQHTHIAIRQLGELVEGVRSATFHLHVPGKVSRPAQTILNVPHSNELVEHVLWVPREPRG